MRIKARRANGGKSNWQADKEMKQGQKKKSFGRVEMKIGIAGYGNLGKSAHKVIEELRREGQKGKRR